MNNYLMFSGDTIVGAVTCEEDELPSIANAYLISAVPLNRTPPEITFMEVEDDEDEDDSS